MGKFAHLYLKEQTRKTVTESTEQLNENIVSHVAVHKAYPGKVAAIKADLQKHHSTNGEELHTSEHGDHIHIHLPNKGHNTEGSVKGTLSHHDGHPAYSAEHNVVTH